MECEDLRLRKAEIRQQALALRRAQPDKDELSQRILTRALGLPQFQDARTVLFYVGVRSEVRTLATLRAQLESNKRIAVPYCAGDELRLFHLAGEAELEPADFGLLEPRRELRELPPRQVAVTAVDLVLVPGLAFDPQGARCGHGKGYYDRLLQHARPDALLVGIAFQCQVFPEIPVHQHDMFMDLVVTEQRIYCGRGRGA